MTTTDTRSTASAAEADPRGVPRMHASFLAILAAYAWLVHHLTFVSDDAFINFRFARNLADGAGFVFNPGVEGPVEGTSELLWVFLLVPFEALGLGSSVAALFVSIACGVALLVRVERTLRADLRLSPAATFLGTAFVGLHPVIGAWSTGGLSTLPFALVLFELYRRSLVVREGGQTRACVLLALAAVLLRAESVPWVLGLVAAAWLAGRWRDEPARRRTAWVTGIVVLVAVLLLVLARLAYFGHPLPNTAYAKVGFTPAQLLRGVAYLLRFLALFPATVLVLGFALFSLTRARREQLPAWLGAWLCLAMSALFSIAVGGDFMAMFRFAAPAMAFVGILFALALEPWLVRGFAARRLALGAALAVLAANLPAAFGHEPLQQLLDRWSGRGGRRQSQLAELRWQRANSDLWGELGRVLRLVAPPNASLVARGIGAVSYHSGLTIYDRHGLVSAEVAHSGTPRTQAVAAHDLFVPVSYFEPHRPTYAYAGLHTAEELLEPKILLRRIWGHPGDGESPARYRPVVHHLPWLERPERYLLLAERSPSPPVDPTAWTAPLLRPAEVRELPPPPAPGR